MEAALIPIIISIYFALYPDMLKGKVGELITRFTIIFSLPFWTYRSFHNVIIPSSNGTAQLDHIILSPYGIFIIETKNYSGLILGGEKQPKWTQVLRNKHFVFQNPLRQAYRQKSVLAEYLNLNKKQIKVVINFVGECTLSSKLPNNVIKKGLGFYIKGHKTQVYTKSDIDIFTEKLNALRHDRTLTTKNHIISLYNRHNSLTICPKCGGNLVEHSLVKDDYESLYLRCQNFPRCRFMKEKNILRLRKWGRVGKASQQDHTNIAQSDNDFSPK